MSEEDTVDELKPDFKSCARPKYDSRRLAIQGSLKRPTREGRKLAKQERRLFDYLNFSFSLQNSTDSSIDGDVSRDMAIEMMRFLRTRIAASVRAQST
ncbi:MAG: hypothetical protein U0892_20080 [Pirellulales bacterium]